MGGLAGHQPTLSHGACDIGSGSFGSCWQGDESHYSTHCSATFNGCSILDWEASLEARSKPRAIYHVLSANSKYYLWSGRSYYPPRGGLTSTLMIDWVVCIKLRVFTRRVKASVSKQNI